MSSTAPDAARNSVGTGLSTTRSRMNVGIWNVRTLLQAGQLNTVVPECERLQIDIVGVSETHWKPNVSCLVRDGWTFYYSGQEEHHRNGVGFLVSPNMAGAVTKVIPVNDSDVTPGGSKTT